MPSGNPSNPKIILFVHQLINVFISQMYIFNINKTHHKMGNPPALLQNDVGAAQTFNLLNPQFLQS